MSGVDYTLVKKVSIGVIRLMVFGLIGSMGKIVMEYDLFDIVIV